MTPDSVPAHPPDRRDQRNNSGGGGDSGDGETVEAVLDLTLEAADLTCEAASCFDALPDCSVIDCDPGCL